jgi:hypothetical protein
MLRSANHPEPHNVALRWSRGETHCRNPILPLGLLHKLREVSPVDAKGLVNTPIGNAEVSQRV